MISRRRRIPARTLVAVALLASACVTPIERPADCDADAVRRSATLTSAGRLAPQTIVVCRGQEVTLAIEVEADGVLHLHGYDDQTPARSVETGTPIEMTFDAVHSGQFVIELHAPGATAGTGAGVFTVNEP